jgi:hypothetical protein
MQGFAAGKGVFSLLPSAKPVVETSINNKANNLMVIIHYSLSGTCPGPKGARDPSMWVIMLTQAEPSQGGNGARLQFFYKFNPSPLVLGLESQLVCLLDSR